MALMIRAFPRADITIAVASRRDAWAIRRHLDPRVSEEVRVFTRGGCDSAHRVRVATFGSLDRRRADLLVLADSAEVVQRVATDVVIRLANQHVFGFTPPGGLRGAWLSRQVEALLGPVIHRVGDPAGRPAEVVVRVAESPRVAASGRASGLGRKREAFWFNDRRNAAVARVARAVAEGDTGTLREHGLEPHGWADRVAPARVAVLVESPEHGRELARRLPGWDLEAGPPGPTSGDDPGPARSILTLVHAHHRIPLEVDVLVLADGGPGRLDLPGFPPPRPDGGGVAVVDFGDEFDREASEATRGRLRASQGLGWRVEAPARWGRLS